MNKKTKKVIIISLLVASVLAIASAVCLASLIRRDERFDISKSPATLVATPNYGQNYVNNLIFLGDFTSFGMIECGVLDGGVESNQVWTGRNGTLPLDYNTDKTTVVLPEIGEEMLLSKALSEKKPRYIVITLGLENGVPYCEKDAFCDYYGRLIEMIKESSPTTKIILQSILPVTAKYQLKNKEYSNEKIDLCNTWICELAEKHGIRFINTAEALKDSSGNLAREYATDTGNCPNTEGYKKVLEYIRAHGYVDYPEGSTQPPTETPTEQPSETATE